MNFSSLIHGFYPRVFRQCFLINRLDPIDLLSAALHCTLSMRSSIQTVKVCIKRCLNDWCGWSNDVNVLFTNGVDKCPGNAFRSLVNHLSKIRAFKLHFKIAFSNFDPSWNQTYLLTLIFLFLSWYFQKTGYHSPVRHKIYYFGSDKTDIEYTCNVFFSVY